MSSARDGEYRVEAMTKICVLFAKGVSTLVTVLRISWDCKIKRKPTFEEMI